MLLHVTRMKFITILKILVVLRKLSLVSGLTEMVSTIFNSVLLLCTSIRIMFLLFYIPLPHTMFWLTTFCTFSLSLSGFFFFFWFVVIFVLGFVSFFSSLTSQALSWVVSSLCRIWKPVKEVFFRSHWKELTWNLCTVRYEGNLWEDWAWSFLQHAFKRVSSSQSIN